MKISRFIALAAIALLVVGAMGFVGYKAFAQNNQPPAATDCNGQDDDAAEAAETGPDTDDIEEQCGSQDEDLDEAGEVDTDDVEDAACLGELDDDAAEAAETGPDTDDIQEGCGSQVEDADQADITP